MNTLKERILIVEDDIDVSDLIARQVLKPLGYRVKVVHEAPMAIHQAINFSPDVLIANLNLSGLSGKDLLVALSSQGLKVPVIVIAEKGMEGDVIQAFRLGASDYLSWPIREAEVVSAVERALKGVRSSREREVLSQKVKDTNLKLQSRVRELTTIMGIGKAVSSITDRGALFNKIIEGAVFVSEADKGRLLLRDGQKKSFLLSAQKNLPRSIVARLDHHWDDGISSLVAISGESLSIHGTPLKRFKVARLGKSALVVPVKFQKEVVGLMVVMRDDPKPFTSSNKALLEALADYASVSLVNVSLFQAVEDRAHSLQTVAESVRESERIKSEILKKISQEMENPLLMISQEVEVLNSNRGNTLSKNQLASINSVKEHLHQAISMLDGFILLEKASAPLSLVTVSLIDLARQAVARHQKIAKNQAVSLHEETPSEPIFILADVDQIAQVLDTLVSNAIRVSTNGKVVLKVYRDKDGNPHAYIKDSGPGISKKDQAKIFDPFFKLGAVRPDDKDQLGIGLVLVKEIIKAHGGKLWVESQLGQGSTFYFSLQPAK